RSPRNPSLAADRIIIPSSFSGGFADQVRTLTDAIAILRHYPSYFVIATCNNEWSELKEHLHD
ncbi:unnamed protein product, partial [Ectocarpus sp. 12 AP-2014]